MINFDPVDFSGFGFRLYQGKITKQCKNMNQNIFMQIHIYREFSSNKTDNKNQVSIYENLISVYIFNS